MLAERLAEANANRFLLGMWSFGNGRTLHAVAFDRHGPKAIEECTGLLNLEFMQQYLDSKSFSNWRRFAREGRKLEQRATAMDASKLRRNKRAHLPQCQRRRAPDSRAQRAASNPKRLAKRVRKAR